MSLYLAHIKSSEQGLKKETCPNDMQNLQDQQQRNEKCKRWERIKVHCRSKDDTKNKPKTHLLKIKILIFFF